MKAGVDSAWLHSDAMSARMAFSAVQTMPPACGLYVERMPPVASWLSVMF